MPSAEKSCRQALLPFLNSLPSSPSPPAARLSPTHKWPAALKALLCQVFESPFRRALSFFFKFFAPCPFPAPAAWPPPFQKWPAAIMPLYARCLKFPPGAHSLFLAFVPPAAARAPPPFKMARSYRAAACQIAKNPPGAPVTFFGSQATVPLRPPGRPSPKMARFYRAALCQMITNPSWRALSLF